MNEYRIQHKLMGSAFELIIGGESKERSKQLLDQGVEEIKRIEDLLTEFNASSITSSISKNAGLASIKVPAEVSNLITRCLNISELTQGAFDVTIKPLKKFYKFKSRALQLPDKKQLSQALTITGYKNIQILKDHRVFLKRKGMQLSFASIGKGYAADQVRQMWLKAGVQYGVVNASGDLNVIGGRPDGSPWKVGIADPRDSQRTILYIPIQNGAVATSGDYEQYFELNGQRYSHTLNPATGLPVNGIKSVTVQGVSSELCDALATAVTVMGIEVGLHFINQLPDTHCLIVDNKNQLHFSKNIKFEHN